MCTRQLADLQLAIVLARLHAAQAPELLRKTVEAELLPHAAQTGDAWLAAVAHLLLKDPLDAIAALANAGGKGIAGGAFRIIYILS